jgi:hypothetical protein
LTPAIVREIIKWITDHLDHVEPIKILLRHVYLPIKLSEEQLEDLIARVTKARDNEKELSKISEDFARISEENIRQMFV